MNLRRFKLQDGHALIAVFRNAVRQLGPSSYSPAQVDAWERYADEPEKFLSGLAQGHTVIAESDGAVVAFGQLHPSSHVEMLYCHPAHAGQGMATVILMELERVARMLGSQALTADSSLVAQPFFAKRGYRTIAVERVACFGVELDRHRVQKSRTPNQALEPTTTAVTPAAVHLSRQSSRGSSQTSGEERKSLEFTTWLLSN